MTLGTIIYKYTTFDRFCFFWKNNWLSIILSIILSLIFLIAIPFVAMGNIEAGRSDNVSTVIAFIIALMFTIYSYRISNKCIDTANKTYIERMILLVSSFLSIVFFWPLIYSINVSIKINYGGYLIFVIIACIYIVCVFIFIAYINSYLQRYKDTKNIRFSFFPIFTFLLLVISFEVTSTKFCHENDIWYSKDTGELVSNYEISIMQFHGTKSLTKVAFAPFWKSLDKNYQIFTVIPEKEIKLKALYKSDKNSYSFDGLISVNFLSYNSKNYPKILSFSFEPMDIQVESKEKLYSEIRKNILSQLELDAKEVKININADI